MRGRIPVTVLPDEPYQVSTDASGGTQRLGRIVILRMQPALTGVRVNPTPRGSRRTSWRILILAAALLAVDASAARTSTAQVSTTRTEADRNESGTERGASAAEARAEAEAARESAAVARERLEAARRELEAATRRAQQTARDAEEAEEAAAEAEAAARKPEAAAGAEGVEARSRDVDAAVRRAEQAEQRAREAERRAEDAAAKADAALAKVEALERRFAYDRTGLFLGAGVYWAPEDFDVRDDVRVDESAGAFARVGYRVHPRVAVDVRFDYLDDFDLEDAETVWSLDAYSITGNVRVFLLTERFQPWLGLGAGAVRSDLEARDRATGVELETLGRETDSTVRFAAGLDFYLTPHLALSLEGAYQAVGGVRSYIGYGQLGAGLDFRF